MNDKKSNLLELQIDLNKKKFLFMQSKNHKSVYVTNMEYILLQTCNFLFTKVLFFKAMSLPGIKRGSFEILMRTNRRLDIRALLIIATTEYAKNVFLFFYYRIHEDYLLI